MSPVLDQKLASLKACAEIVSESYDALVKGKEINLNGLRSRISKKYKLANIPRLVDIIAAVPEDQKSVLLPKFKAKPVRTASGIAVVAVMCKPHRCPHIAMTKNVIFLQIDSLIV